MKILNQIIPKIKEIFGQAIVIGMEKGEYEINNNTAYKVAVGIDNRKRVINTEVQSALFNVISSVKEKSLSVKTGSHKSGHLLRINYGRFIIYPKRVDDLYLNYYEDEPAYHKALIAKNPSKQYDLFNVNDLDTPVFVQLLFGKEGKKAFAALRVLDSSYGIYEEEKLELPSIVVLAPEEKAPVAKKLAIRSEKVAGK
jgi:hypothetical protein